MVGNFYFIFYRTLSYKYHIYTIKCILFNKNFHHSKYSKNVVIIYTFFNNYFIFRWSKIYYIWNNKTSGVVYQNKIRATISQLLDTPKISRNPPEKSDRYGAHDCLVAAYFSKNLVYDEQVFRRRFRMSRRLFLWIVHDIKSRSRYFQQMQDARGKLGFSALQKCTSAIHQPTLGSIPNAQDEYLQMSEPVSQDSLNKFYRWFIKLYTYTE